MERKKKRGNAIFFVSRNALRPFSTISSWEFASLSCSSSPLKSATVRMWGVLLTFCMISLQMVSISRKAVPSFGICFIISSDPNMGSR